MHQHSPAVEVSDLVREFRPRKKPHVLALDRVSLTIPRGEVHGLLGPNGAGKTTLVKILTTVLLPTSGRVTICGYDVVSEAPAVRPLIGVVFGGERGLYTRLSARQNLEYWGALYRLPRALIRPRTDQLLERIGLSDKADQRVETYSRGMKQRLHLARGLIANAAVLFLDEPTTGMDPVATLDFRNLISELRGEGRTVLLTTHDMAEAEVLCDRVTLIDRGTVTATESPRSLATLVSRFQRVEVETHDDGLLDLVKKIPGVEHIHREGDIARIHVDGERAVGDILQFLIEHGATTIRTSRPSLEEVYLSLIGPRGLEVLGMNDVIAGCRLQLAFFRNEPDMLVPLLTAPLYTVIFAMILRHGGRADLVGYAVLAPFYMSLWWFALFSGGWVIQVDRWEGTIEYLVAAPSRFAAVVLGRVAANLLAGIAAFGEVWLFGRYVMRANVTIHHLALFGISFILTLFAMAATALFMAILFVLARNAVTFSNSASFPFYVLGGILVPVTLLPGWLQPISKLVFLSWSAMILRGSLAVGPVPDAGLALMAIFALGCAALVVAHVLLRRVLERVRQNGELSLR